MASVSARQVLDNAMSEQELQSLILEYAQARRWRCHHQLVPFRRGKDGRVRAIVEPHTDKGFPDLVLARAGVVWYFECKTEKGKLTDEQRAWRDILIAAGCRWKLVQPHMWDEIAALLEG
jgi:hypothetical protein